MMRLFQNSRRLALAMVVSLLLVGGCTTSESTLALSASEAPVELVFAGFSGHGFAEGIRLWELEHPGVRVIIEERGFDDHHTELNASVATGDAPDVAMIEVAFVHNYTENAGDLVDLRNYGADEIEDRYLDWRWAQGVAEDGEVIGIPTDFGGLAVAYRRDLFEAAGLPVDRDEVAALWPTWEAFQATGERFVANSDSAFLDDSVSLLEVIMKQDALQFYDADGQFIALENPAVREAFAQATEFAKAGLDSGVTAFSPEWNAGMADGTYAVLLAPAWMMSYIQEQAPGTAGLWDIASIPEQGGNWGGSQLAVPIGSEEPELAWDLISYLLGPRGQLNVFDDHGNFPTIVALFDEPRILESRKDFFNDAPVGRIYVQSALALEPIILGEHQRIAQTVLGDAIELAREGSLTLSEAWAKVERDLTALDAG